MPRLSLAALILLLSLEVACSSYAPARRSSSALDFLYPSGTAAQAAATDVTLRLPVRVGLAFAPGGTASYGEETGGLTEAERQVLLDKVAAAFRKAKGVGSIEVVPSLYLTPGGGFTNLDRLRSTLGIDLMVLVSYDQAQFTESTRVSWTYLTVIGPLLIEGEKNEVRTLVDAVIYDIPSRALLFRAAGESTVGGRSSPLNETRKRRRFSTEGFAKATDDLIVNLGAALEAFEQQSQSGTVRGQGTPRIAVYDAAGQQVNTSEGGGSGAFGPFEMALAGLLGLAWLVGRRRPARGPTPSR